MNNSDVIVLLSGGMDSATCLAFALDAGGHAARNAFALSFDYGQRHRNKELEAAQRVAAYYDVAWDIIDLEQLQQYLGGSALTDGAIDVPEGHYTDQSMKSTVVPNRNAIMLSIAFGIARAQGARDVYAGMHAGDHAIYPDCRPAFVEAFNNAMRLANDDLVVGKETSDGLRDKYVGPILVTPFINMTKTDIVTAGHLLHVPYYITYSCYNGRPEHCGKCGTCVERKEAFHDAGVEDPTTYETEP